MTAILRTGGEWDFGSRDLSFVQAKASLTGTTSLVTPGRTGGKAYRAADSGFWTAVSDYDMSEGLPIIGRGYFRVNQLPVTDNGERAVLLTVDTGLPGFSPIVPVGLILRDDGRLRFAAGGIDPQPPDTPDFEPVVTPGEWVMVELVTTLVADAGGKRLEGLRVTFDGEEPWLAYFRACAEGSGGSDESAQAMLTFGDISGVGDGFTVDWDDLGINVADDGPNNTWLGPGAVRMARPTAYAAADVFEQGAHSNTARGVQGRTIADNGTGTLTGPALVVCTPMNDFADILARDNPVFSPSTLARCEHGDEEVNSSGSDYHKQFQTAGTFAWNYDWPRVGSAGDQLDLTLDASDQAGDLSFAMAFTIAHATRSNEDPHYFGLYTDNETPPTYGDASDDANMPIHAIDNTEHQPLRARLQQQPTLGTSPHLVVERQHACHASSSPPYWEWEMLIAGVVYESGYVPQPALPTCGGRGMTWT